MSLNFVSFDVQQEINSLASRVFTFEEELIWYKMYFIAAQTIKREGYLELVETMPYTTDDIALKLYIKNKHDLVKLVELVQSTLDKAVKNNMMGISNNGSYYFKNWSQLSKEQRKLKHRTMQAGQCVENGSLDVKPIVVNSEEKDEKLATIYANKQPDTVREALSTMHGDEIKTVSGDKYNSYQGKDDGGHND